MVFLAAMAMYTSPAKTGERSSEAQKGLEISRTHCARCHVVEQDRPFSGISSTPSFFLLVTALDDWEIRFRSFHTRLPHPSIVRFAGEQPDPNREDPNKPVEIEYRDIEAILAYAKSLAKPD